jgi:hypothetical protein
MPVFLNFPRIKEQRSLNYNRIRYLYWFKKVFLFDKMMLKMLLLPRGCQISCFSGRKFVVAGRKHLELATLAQAGVANWLKMNSS